MRKAIWPVLIFLGFIIFVGWRIDVSSGGTSTTRSTNKSPARQPVLKVQAVVEKSEYQYGYLTVSGTAKNIGQAPIFSFELQLSVHRKSDGTLLAQETTSPAGCFLDDFPVGRTAAFEFIAMVPGEPARITYEVGSATSGVICLVSYPK